MSNLTTLNKATPLAYLDNNATTQVDAKVLEQMLPYLSEFYGNPSSIHQFGEQVGKAIEHARQQVQDLIGASFSSEVIFTSCATEASATAIMSAIEAFPNRKELITSVIEHPATLELCQNLERKGYTVHWIKVDARGRLDMEAYKQALSSEVAVASFMWANNETGSLFPIRGMAELAKQHGILFHTDAVQVAGKLPIQVADSGIDLLSISGHKFHAPKGVGALYLRRGAKFRPLLRGGHQERGRRAGTENSSGIVGLGKAAELAMQSIEQDSARIKMMRDRLEMGLLARIPHCFVTGDPRHRVPNTSNIAFEFVEGESILLMLDQHGIAASSGSACTSGSLEPSHVMRAMDIPYTAAHGAIRFSLSRFTSEEMIDQVLAVLPGIVEKLRMLSPYWDTASNQPAEQSFSPVYA
ncbi:MULTISPECIES: cysteine desulfurase NifS [unclassified Agarivorans]|uniref:cysteine desulfurase NifS n=1 Tax=unclassified Agarivorans TaxID=2636026 RepID=UPI0026E18939|nr:MULTISPECIES: cysteine desulfurase NifS [unclassified Agarivorans]MDO6685960.1 cysteine desulfurase NifS [Agarivorans sp. 3_MG-2023]MDO6713902.1 cysteine desulfurase NifS [Agarivorans sp. 2_MG-2023]